MSIVVGLTGRKLFQPTAAALSDQGMPDELCKLEGTMTVNVVVYEKTPRAGR